jgi:hypothetical protein
MLLQYGLGSTGPDGVGGDDVRIRKFKYLECFNFSPYVNGFTARQAAFQVVTPNAE